MDPHVLLVEDHADTRALYAFDLLHAGFQVTEADNAADALYAIARSLPDVVVTDLRMPGIGGMSLCRILHENQDTRDVPLIAVTACADRETVDLARDAGCAAVLVKPCAPADLRREIARVLELSRTARRRSAAALERAAALSRKSAALKAKADAACERAQQCLGDVQQQLALRLLAEFQQNAGLCLSARQVAQFMRLDEPTALLILDDLTRTGLLRRTTAGMYLARE